MNFYNTANGLSNLLPQDGVVHYYGKVLEALEADFYLNCLLRTISWKNDEAVIFGRHISTKRKVAWYGNTGFSYTYSRTTKKALLWTPELLTIKQQIESYTGDTFNSCLLNLYHNGEEGMAWHSDDEKTLGYHASIASVSLGAERKFTFKHKKTKQTIPIVLENGSLLVMKETTQTHWLHALPKSKKVSQPRLNLTFRTMVGESKTEGFNV